MGVLRCVDRGEGLHLPELGLWLDPRKAKREDERVVISHAHSDHVGAHREIVVSEGTSKLLQVRMPGERVEHVLGWGESRSFRTGSVEWRVTLHPAGHIWGSAMVLVEAGDASLLYTGDFKLRPGRSAERCVPVRAQVLVMETTFGRPVYVFPPAEEVMEGVRRFCRAALNNDEVPVLLGYSLGKSQEILSYLADAGLPLAVHPQVARLTQVYEAAGHLFPPYVLAEAGGVRGRVLLCPPGAKLSAVLKDTDKVRRAVLTGWALDSGCRYRYGVEAAFPLSDHADYRELWEMVERVGPEEVFTVHGFASEFAGDLRARGYRAQALGREEPLELALELRDRPGPVDRRQPGSASRAVVPVAWESGEGGLARWAAGCEGVGQEREPDRKVARLAAMLGACPVESAAIGMDWLEEGRGEGKGARSPRVDGALVRRAICRALGISEAEVRECHLIRGGADDGMGDVVGDWLSRSGQKGVGASVTTVAASLVSMREATGTESRVEKLVGLLAGCSPVEGWFLVQVLMGTLRLGLSDAQVEEAVAIAYHQDLVAVRRAYPLVGSWGHLCRLAVAGRLGEVRVEVFRPVKGMPAFLEKDAASLWRRVEEAGETKVWVEDKHDGMRCQWHQAGGQVRLFSPDRQDLTGLFPAWTEGGTEWSEDAVLDGDLVAMRGGRVVPFSMTERGLVWPEGELFSGSELRVCYRAFDVLRWGGEDWWDEPWVRRREVLEGLRRRSIPGQVEVVDGEWVGSEGELEHALREAQGRGAQGCLLKLPQGRYCPGEDSRGWMRWETALEGGKRAAGLGRKRRLRLMR